MFRDSYARRTAFNILYEVNASALEIHCYNLRLNSYS